MNLLICWILSNIIVSLCSYIFGALLEKRRQENLRQEIEQLFKLDKILKGMK